MDSLNNQSNENAPFLNKEAISFEDALLELKFVSSQELQDALRQILPKLEKSKELPAALIEANLITRDQARKAFYLQLKERYQSAFEGYEIIETLGQGAVGTVFRAHQARLERDVAIKVLDEAMALVPAAREAFLSEARAAVRLSHPNIIQGYEVIERDDLCAYVMEFVEGRTVDALVDGRGPMEERQALNIVRDIARALEHAEESGIVHRDIKPANLIVGRNRVAKLLDMGLAKVIVGPGSDQSDKGMAVGTPNYMSPEQIRGEKTINTRADIYSLGATLFFMMTGQTPFSGKPEVVMYKHIHEPPASPKNLRPECSNAMVSLIFKMMAKDPADRPTSGTALIDAIDDTLSQAGKAQGPIPIAVPIAPTPEEIKPEAEPQLPTRRGRKPRNRGTRNRRPNAALNLPTPSAPETPASPAPKAPAVKPPKVNKPSANGNAPANAPKPVPIPLPPALGGPKSAPQPIEPAQQKAPQKRSRRRNMR